VTTPEIGRMGDEGADLRDDADDLIDFGLVFVCERRVELGLRLSSCSSTVPSCMYSPRRDEMCFRLCVGQGLAASASFRAIDLSAALTAVRMMGTPGHTISFVDRPDLTQSLT
jgi:hypothetical protein